MLTAVPVRICAIARTMGEDADCPPGGCALALHLGVTVPDHGTCPVEALAGDSPLATATLNGLRHELESPAPYEHPLRREEDRQRRHAALLWEEPTG